MIRLFQFLIHGCFHHWEIIDRVRVNDDDVRSWTRTYCVCTKCGRPAKFD